MPDESRLKKLGKDVKEGRLMPVYLFDGPDDYRKRRAVEAVARALGGDAAVPVEWVEAASAGYACDRAKTQPFFATKRLLVALGAERYEEADIVAVEGYAAAPAADAVVIFWAAGPLDRRKKIYKFFDKIGAAFTFNFLAGDARRARIAAEAKRLGAKLAPDALAFLDRTLGPDLYTVIRELEKLATYAGDKEIDARTAAAVVVTSKPEDVYEAVRNVMDRNVSAALSALRRLLLAGERPESLVGLFARQIRLIWLAKELAAEGLTPGQIATQLGVPPFYVGEYTTAAARASREQLAELHRLLADLDLAVKNGRLPPEMALDIFTVGTAATD